MKLLFCLLLIGPQLFHDTESVSYGKFVPIEQAPYYVSLLNPRSIRYQYFCGGSIISEYWIVTAAHCVDEPFDKIICGESIRHQEWMKPSTYRVDKVFVHGGYVADPIPINDIALIKLKEPIGFTEQRQPIKIRRTPPRENETLIIMGMGTQGDAKDLAPVLKQSEVTVVGEEACKDADTPHGLLDVALCAGDGSTDVCPGDSGGPAVIDGELAGLVSFGPACTIFRGSDDEGGPGVYTRLDAFYDWIVNITGLAL